MARKQEYGNESITSLKGADRVRKRPAVIFGSDGVEGCAHSIFEIVSNSIDEARDGHGDTINVTRCKDGSVIVENVKSSHKNGYGYDALKGEYVDMIERGIIDPTKVTRCALQNAASVAAMVLTTESLVADIPAPEPAAPAGGAGMGGMGGMY